MPTIAENQHRAAQPARPQRGRHRRPDDAAGGRRRWARRIGVLCLAAAVAGLVPGAADAGSETPPSPYEPVISVSASSGKDADDDSAELQSALDRAAAAHGGVVYVPTGTFLVGHGLTIGSGVELRLAPQAVLKRNSAAMTLLLTNAHDGKTGGYGQARNIRITGGIIDGDLARFPNDNMTMLMFGHVDGLTIDGVRLQNLGGTYHMIEVNSSRNVQIVNNRLRNQPGRGDPSRLSHAEMIQVDAAYNAAHIPFGPYDLTPASNVLIQGNTLSDGQRGIGSHGAQAVGHFHQNVRIVANHFQNFSIRALTPTNTSGLVVADNTAVDVASFLVYDAPPDGATPTGITVSGNTVTNTRMQDSANGGGIMFNGLPGPRNIWDVTVTGNTLNGMGRYGIVLNWVSGFAVADNVVRSTGARVARSASSVGIGLFGAANGSVTGNRVNATAPQVAWPRVAGDLVVGAPVGSSRDTTNIELADNKVQRMAVGLVDHVGAHDLQVDVFGIFPGTRQVEYRPHDNWVGGRFHAV